ATGAYSGNLSEPSERHLMPAIAHITPDAFQELIKRPRRIVKHRHLLSRLRQMRRQQHLLALRDLFGAPVQIRGSSKQRVWREPDPATRISRAFHRVNCKLDKVTCAIWIAHID